MSNQLPSLTICSVYHSEMTARILEMNGIFIRKMNPNISWTYLAVNNSPQESIHLKSAGIKEFPGVPLPENLPPYPGPISTWSSYTGYFDGGASNSLLKHIKTRFVVFLDYDFFIVRPNWINDVLSYMEKENIGILGAPYHPKYWVKFRYFPSKNCIFVDREKIGKEFYDWDFRPQYSIEEVKKTMTAARHKAEQKAKHPKPPPSKLRRFFQSIRKRHYLGLSKDVGFNLRRRYYGQDKIKYECFQPTVVLNDFLYHYYLDGHWHKILYQLEKLVPERWSFVPKKKNYFTFKSFKNVGFFDVLSAGMEEWWWREVPFGFHLRGFKERHLKEIGENFDPEENIRIIKTATDNFTYHQ